MVSLNSNSCIADTGIKEFSGKIFMNKKAKVELLNDISSFQTEINYP